MSAYRDYPLIRYIYGRQINLIYEKIYKKKDNDILPLLKFISGNSVIEDKNIDYKVDNEKDIYFNINSYLEALFNKNNINYEKIKEDNENNKLKKKMMVKKNFVEFIVMNLLIFKKMYYKYIKSSKIQFQMQKIFYFAIRKLQLKN